MKLKKCFLIILTFIALVSIANVSKAEYLEFENLDIEANLQENGDMKVTEYWKIDIEDTNTLFKDWNLNNGKYGGFTDVKVYEILENGTKKEFTKINEEMYHVTKDCFYALPISGGKFEVAWGVQVSNDVKNYEITYTVKDIVKKYEDCCEFYWQFLGTDNATSAQNVTGTITLPRGVMDKNNLRAWAHGPLNGVVEINSNDTVKFAVTNLNSETMLELRLVVLDNGVFSNIPSTINSTKNLESIMAEETAWANEANRIREENTKNIQTVGMIYIAISALLVIFLIFKLQKAKRKKNEKLLEAIKPVQEFEYFRDIPDETASPAEALFITKYPYYSSDAFNIGNSSSLGNAKILSATILNLCLKKKIEFEVDSNVKKDNITFLIKNSDESAKEGLTEDEKIILDILIKAADYRKDEEEINSNVKKVTVKEIEKYASKNAESFIKKIETINAEAKNAAEKKEKYSKLLKKNSEKWNIYFILYFVFGFFGLAFLLLPGILMFIISSYYYKIYKMLNTLTQKGEDEKAKWNGLKKYMEEFSLLKDKEVPHLVLWEKYLVYATVFGIADKVIKQLKIEYPEFTNNADYAYMYMIYNTSFTTNFIHSLDTALTNTYNNVSASYYNSQSSSGGGFGGGFSGGGGGGCGGGGCGGR